MKQKTFLICILNWGIGHATRCIPIINQLLIKKQKVIIASSGLSLQLLKKEYKNQITFFDLPDYQINYGNGHFFFLKMMVQIPQILATIKQENTFVKKICENEKVDVLLSDNRFGCHYKKIPNYFLTHQLYIKITKPLVFLQPLLAKLNFKYINRFQKCLIFDEENNLLSGELSAIKNKKIKPKIPVEFIGALSRTKTEIHKNNTNDILIIISGPEPQRTIFENKIIQDAKDLKNNKKILLVRGTTKKIIQKPIKNIEIIDFADSNTINRLLNTYQNIICRSGYSSILDLFKLNKKAILVATPKQTEQEYLAQHLSVNFGFKSILQKEFKLEKAIKIFEHKKWNLLPKQEKSKTDLLGIFLAEILKY